MNNFFKQLLGSIVQIGMQELSRKANSPTKREGNGKRQGFENIKPSRVEVKVKEGGNN